MRITALLIKSLLSLSLSALAGNSLAGKKENTLLFFGHDNRQPVTAIAHMPWDAIGQLETSSGNLCSATLITPHLALTAGHCLLAPPGKPDKPVALRFMAHNNHWRYELHHITARVNPKLGSRLRADGDGWIVPASAAVYDYGIIILHSPPSAITPMPLFSGTDEDMMGIIRSHNRRITQAGYPEDHLDQLYAHSGCLVTGWAQQGILSHQCDTLPGDSGSPLMLYDNGRWQLIGVQSSAPAPQDRYRADNHAVAVTAFAEKLRALLPANSADELKLK